MIILSALNFNSLKGLKNAINLPFKAMVAGSNPATLTRHKVNTANRYRLDTIRACYTCITRLACFFACEVFFEIEPNPENGSSAEIEESIISIYHCISDENHPFVRRHILTNISITGTSIKTPTTVANAAPDESPNNITDVDIATSK